MVRFRRAAPPLPLLLLTLTGLSLSLSALATLAAGDRHHCTRWPRAGVSERESCGSCLLRWFNVSNATPDAMELRLAHATRLEMALPRPALPVCKLRAARCSVSDVAADELSGLRCLRHLFLAANDLRTISPDAFRDNEELETVDLHDNHRLALPPDRPLVRARSLRVLNLSSCNLSVIYDVTFEGVPNLKILYLTFNRIQTLQFSMFQNLSKLQFLDVSENKLTSVRFLPALASVTCFAAVGNPLRDLAGVLGKVRRDSELALSKQFCCDEEGACQGWTWNTAEVWKAKCAECSKCPVNRATSPTASAVSTTTLILPAISSTTFSSSLLPSTTTTTSLMPPTTELKARPTTEGYHPNASNGTLEGTTTTEPPDKPAAIVATDVTTPNQSANVAIILLSVIFSFFLILQSIFIVILLIRFKRRKNTNANALLAVINSEINVPQVIYGANVQVTDLDDDSCSHLSLNPVYETIPE